MLVPGNAYCTRCLSEFITSCSHEVRVSFSGQVYLVRVTGVGEVRAHAATSIGQIDRCVGTQGAV